MKIDIDQFILPTLLDHTKLENEVIAFVKGILGEEDITKWVRHDYHDNMPSAIARLMSRFGGESKEFIDGTRTYVVRYGRQKLLGDITWRPGWVVIGIVDTHINGLYGDAIFMAGHPYKDEIGYEYTDWDFGGVDYRAEVYHGS